MLNALRLFAAMMVLIPASFALGVTLAIGAFSMVINAAAMIAGL